MINVKHNELLEKFFNGFELDGLAQPSAIEIKTRQTQN